MYSSVRLSNVKYTKISSSSSSVSATQFQVLIFTILSALGLKLYLSKLPRDLSSL